MRVTCFPNPVQKFTEANSLWEWHFTVRAKSDLKCVSFRNASENGCTFSILFVSGPKIVDEEKVPPPLHAPFDHTEWLNPTLIEGALDQEFLYTIRVVFQSFAFGKYSQAVEFTFASGKKSSCQLSATVTHANPLVDAGVVSMCLRREVIPKSNHEMISNRALTSSDRHLLERYVLHDHAPLVLATAFGEELEGLSERKQLKVLLHSFLFVEEVTQVRLAMKYACLAELKLRRSIGGEDGNLRISQNEELFAEVHLEMELDDDSPEAQVMISSVNIAYLDLMAGDDVFGDCEATVEEKRKQSVILRLSETSVKLNRLVDGDHLRAFVRFLPNRLPFCERHWGVDELQYFPLDAKAINKMLSATKPFSSGVGKLRSHLSVDQNQERALTAILQPSSVILPPIIIRGPYGTGKTHTVGAAVMEILHRQPSARILICTQSNSAADLYVTRFFMELSPEDRYRFLPYRIYYVGRRLASIDPKILPFCNVKNDPPSLHEPGLEEVSQRRVVITTCVTARLLRDIGAPRGFFSHIFLDEAGQALICEALIPLALCDQITKVILAGDPKQMCSKVFCNFAQHFRFDYSLLEYIGQHYPEEHPCHVRLMRQHRSDSDLFNIISRTFYPDEFMEALNEEEVSPDFDEVVKEISFHHVDSGHEIDEDGSVFNLAQVERALDVVRDLKKSENSVAVITPSRAQIVRLRTVFRQHGLGDVTVDSVANIQGREYKHIVLSFPKAFRGDGMKWIADVEKTPESDVHMTLTACTRARMSVTLIGNGIYLSLTQHTGRLWRNLLSYCYERSSLFEISQETLLYEVETYERIQKYKMNIKAPEFVPSAVYGTYAPPPLTTFDTAVGRDGETEIVVAHAMDYPLWLKDFFGRRFDPTTFQFPGDQDPMSVTNRLKALTVNDNGRRVGVVKGAVDGGTDLIREIDDHVRRDLTAESPTVAAVARTDSGMMSMSVDEDEDLETIVKDEAQKGVFGLAFSKPRKPGEAETAGPSEGAESTSARSDGNSKDEADTGSVSDRGEGRSDSRTTPSSSSSSDVAPSPHVTSSAEFLRDSVSTGLAASTASSSSTVSGSPAPCAGYGGPYCQGYLPSGLPWTVGVPIGQQPMTASPNPFAGQPMLRSGYLPPGLGPYPSPYMMTYGSAAVPGLQQGVPPAAPYSAYPIPGAVGGGIRVSGPPRMYFPMPSPAMLPFILPQMFRPPVQMPMYNPVPGSVRPQPLPNGGVPVPGCCNPPACCNETCGVDGWSHPGPPNSSNSSVDAPPN